MLLSLKKKGKRLLISVDEVTNTPQMRAFAAAFQIFLRQDLPVYLLMMGLYENVSALQDEKSLTFLYRAPKIHLGPLNVGTIAEDCQAVLGLGEQEGMALARLTKGYSFAFQVLGYFAWENADDARTTQQLARQYLDECAYDKVWSELSRKDREVLYGIAQVKSGRIGDIRALPWPCTMKRKGPLSASGMPRGRDHGPAGAACRRCDRGRTGRRPEAPPPRWPCRWRRRLSDEWPEYPRAYR